MIKEKLVYGSFFYKIYILYHLFIKEKFYIKRSTYSQSQEDLFIVKFFKKKKSGFYLDIGAFHPIKYSNTQLLYNSGWRGINIDMNPVSIDCFNIVRSRDINLKAAISNKKVKARVLINNYFSPTNSLSITHFKKFNKSYSKKKFFFIKTTRVNEIISKKIDFLNIDIEGLDFKVVKDINLKILKPKLVCIEILKRNSKKKYLDYFKRQNYQLIEQISSNLFFSRTKS